MAEGVYYRDPRNPREVHGPYTAHQLRDLAGKRILRPLDQVSLDGRAWLLATEYEPDLFPGLSTDGYAPTPPWKLMVQRAANRLKERILALWASVKEMAAFYWSYRGELRELTGEYI